MFLNSLYNLKIKLNTDKIFNFKILNDNYSFNTKDLYVKSIEVSKRKAVKYNFICHKNDDINFIIEIRLEITEITSLRNRLYVYLSLPKLYNMKYYEQTEDEDLVNELINLIDMYQELWII
jgi:hypothetical protein